MLCGSLFCAAQAKEQDRLTVYSLQKNGLSAFWTDANGNAAKRMLEYASSALTRKNYAPYYMYRQSKCVGNLENVGWCLDGHECLYNVFMMEECHSVLAVGAGAVTKLREPDGTNIERIFNYKYPYEYISGFDKITERKNGIKSFYLSY